jgi:hypothetical protein
MIAIFTLLANEINGERHYLLLTSLKAFVNRTSTALFKENSLVVAKYFT